MIEKKQIIEAWKVWVETPSDNRCFEKLVEDLEDKECIEREKVLNAFVKQIKSARREEFESMANSGASFNIVDCGQEFRKEQNLKDIELATKRMNELELNTIFKTVPKVPEQNMCSGLGQI